MLFLTREPAAEFPAEQPKHWQRDLTTYDYELVSDWINELRARADKLDSKFVYLATERPIDETGGYMLPWLEAVAIRGLVEGIAVIGMTPHDALDYAIKRAETYVAWHNAQKPRDDDWQREVSIFSETLTAFYSELLDRACSQQ